MTIRYEWDDRKRLSNFERHKLDFGDAWRVYEHPDKLTLRDPYPDEPRLKDIAEVGEEVWLLVYTVRDEVIRCISFRIAKRKERRLYYERLQNR
jgi:uncharacterized protein